MAYLAFLLEKERLQYPKKTIVEVQGKSTGLRGQRLSDFVSYLPFLLEKESVQYPKKTNIQIYLEKYEIHDFEIMGLSELKTQDP